MLRGSITALITPMRNGVVDEKAFASFVEWQLAEGTHGLVPVGTTGESPTVSHEEHRRVVEICIEVANGRVPVVAGAGSNSTAEAVSLAKFAEKTGANAALSVVPYYNKPNQEGLFQHFSAVASAIGIPVILYSVPGRTGVAIAPETAAQLAHTHRNIIAIKEAGGDPARVTALRRACGNGFAVHSGDDGLALPFYALGACGLTSVLSNYAPEACVAQYRAFMAGDMNAALGWHERMAELVAALFAETSPGPVKRALAMSNQMSDTMRLPLVRIGEATEHRLKMAIAGFSGAAHPGLI